MSKMLNKPTLSVSKVTLKKEWNALFVKELLCLQLCNVEMVILYAILVGTKSGKFEKKSSNQSALILMILALITIIYTVRAPL